MCLAVPGVLIEIQGLNGVVELKGVRRTARLDLLENPQIGDYVLLHAGFAIERIDAQHAAEIWEAIEANDEG